MSEPTRDTLLRAVRDFIDRSTGAPGDSIALATGFVEAGLSWLRCTRDTRGWVQINGVFAPTDTSPGLALVTGPLQDRVAEALSSGTLAGFHFVFKPPGVRLRFFGATAAIDPIVAELAATRAIVGPVQTHYDCETHQFGGPAGLAAAHRLFTVESLATLRYWRLFARGEARLGRPEFALTLLDLFLRATVGDAWELWDVWCKMALAGRGTGDPAPATIAAADDLITRLRWQDPTFAWLPEREFRVLTEFAHRAEPVAAEWRTLQETGQLVFPLREVLPFLIVFHFNRMGFGAADQDVLTIAMQSLLSPKRSPPRQSATAT